MAAICEYQARKDEAIPELIFHEHQFGGFFSRLTLRARGVRQGSVAVAQVDLRASRQGWLSAFVTYSWVLTGLLAIGAWRLPYILTDKTEIIDLVGVAAALYPFTGLIAKLLVNSGGQGMLRKFLSRLWQVAALTATLPVLAVAGLVLVPSGPPLRWIWFGLAVTALLAATLATASYILPRASISLSRWNVSRLPDILLLSPIGQRYASDEGWTSIAHARAIDGCARALGRFEVENAFFSDANIGSS